MKKAFWHSGALICPRKEGYDIILSGKRWINRETLFSAKWHASVYKTITGLTYAAEIATKSVSNKNFSNNAYSIKSVNFAKTQQEGQVH